MTLRKKCPKTEFFLVRIFVIWTGYDDLRSTGLQKIMDQKNSVFGLFSGSVRPFIHKIISNYWKERIFPSCWKHAINIWIHENGSNMEPSNFHPITLQHFFAKIYSSLIQNRIYSSFLENQFIESNIQEGFWRAISGTIKYAELLIHIIKRAKNKRKDNHYTIGSKKFIWKGRPHNYY